MEQFKIVTTSSQPLYIHMQELEKVKDVQIVRTERVPFPGIIIKCTKETADQLKELSWVGQVCPYSNLILTFVAD